MVTLNQTTVIIPASGQSVRFGASNKLLSELAGKPLAQHAIDCAANIGFSNKIAVIPRDKTALWELFKAAGFDCIHNPAPERGMGHSLALGAKACQTQRAVVMLADMPLVPTGHIHALLDALGDNPVVFTQSASVVHPPAALGSVGLDALRHSDGDQGLRDWTVAAKTVALDPALTQDIDTPESLDVVRRNWDVLYRQSLAADVARR
ncbi:NTP transferase domain-containing protein [Fretibacter rubidus]|uniref:nucleotidyltransferase family protein n=1 Tax=Fretibacter rubidus TaxID=570162 RepID=UPI00352AE49F